MYTTFKVQSTRKHIAKGSHV